VTDNLSKRGRSILMSLVRRKDTDPEIKVRRLAHSLGFRFALHRKDLAGSPDIVFPRYRAVIFVHGCFWHRHRGCRKASTPKTRPEFWAEKFKRNIARDAAVRRVLRKDGWKVMTVWECQVPQEAKLRRSIISLLTRSS
jgi:DNA mismatch endonuclease (patch repair protein)